MQSIPATITSTNVNATTSETVAVWGGYDVVREGAEVVIQVELGDRVAWVSLNPIQSAALRSALKVAETKAIAETRRERGL